MVSSLTKFFLLNGLFISASLVFTLISLYLYVLFTHFSSFYFLRFCVDILFRTFFDILLLYSPWFIAFHFLEISSPLLLLTFYLRSCVDILFRTLLDFLLLHIAYLLLCVHFFAIFPTLYLLSKILRGHIVPHFLSYFLLSLLCLHVFTSLYSESYPRLCVGILLRSLLDSLFSYLLLTSFLPPCILKFFPLTSFFDFVFSFYPSSSLYLRFCVSILFRTFLGFGISLSFSFPFFVFCTSSFLLYL